MKKVVHNREQAIRAIDEVCHSLGPTWEPPQLMEIKRYKPPRSLPQNSIMHSKIGELADWLGYTKSELKEILKAEFGPKHRYQFGKIDKMIPLSTTEYTREQMSEFIGQIERVGAELGFRFSDQDV